MNVVLKKVLASASVALLAASVNVAYAAGGSGTVSFEGEIIDSACSIKPDTSNQTVDLGKIAKSQLASGGVSEKVDFQIELTGCDLATLKDKTVTATFVGSESQDVSGTLGITGNARGAGVVMVDASGTAVKLGTPTKVQLIQAGDNSLLFGAFLKGKATGDITGGKFSAVTNFSLDYL